jgi:hypothetical protein
MRTPKWKIPAAVAALLLLLSATACLERRSNAPREVGGLDKKLSTFAWQEDGNLVALIVDTRAARYSEEAAYMPLEIAVANRGLKDLILTRESFTLVDETGQKYPAVGPRELMEGYDFLDRDRGTLAELQGIVEAKFAAFTQYPSRFSPSRALTRGSNLVQDSVTLPKFGYLVDFIYFPKPATGLKDHKFELQLASPALPADNNPIFVKFMVL